jgi:hypothetical protein
MHLAQFIIVMLMVRSSKPLNSASFPSFSSLAENVHTTVLRAFPIIHNPCLCLLYSKLSYPSINLLATHFHLLSEASRQPSYDGTDWVKSILE